MMRLKSKLLSLNADKADRDKVKVFSPKNCEELRVPFKADKIAKVVGRLAQLPPPSSADDDARLVTGVLVQNDFKMSLMAPEDLREFAGLTTTIITCKQRLTLSAAGVGLVKWALESTFGAIEEIFEEDAGHSTKMNGKAITNGDTPMAGSVVLNGKHRISYLVMGCVVVRYGHRGEVEVEWEGNMLNDGIADAVLAVLFAVESSPAAVKRKFGLGGMGRFKYIDSFADQDQNHQSIRTLTTMTTQIAICTPTFRRPSDSSDSACSWRHNSAPTLLLSNDQRRLPQSLSPTARTTRQPLVPKNLNPRTRCGSNKRLMEQKRWKRPSSNAFTSWASPCRASRSVSTSTWRASGSRPSRSSARIGRSEIECRPSSTRRSRR